MDRKTAESVVSSIEAVAEQLNIALRFAQERFDKDDFEGFRSAVATILVELHASVLRPVYLRHRDLDKYGYLGLPEYPGATPGAIELRNVGQIHFDIDTAEQHLNIDDFNVEPTDTGSYRSSISFWPSGRITALHQDASFPAVRLCGGA